MNKTFKKLCTEALKTALKQLPENQFSVFKKMYSPRNPNMTVDECVDQMPDDRLDWAMTQVENSIAKNAKEAENAS